MFPVSPVHANSELASVPPEQVAATNVLPVGAVPTQSARVVAAVATLADVAQDPATHVFPVVPAHVALVSALAEGELVNVHPAPTPSVHAAAVVPDAKLAASGGGGGSCEGKLELIF